MEAVWCLVFQGNAQVCRAPEQEERVRQVPAPGSDTAAADVTAREARGAGGSRLLHVASSKRQHQYRYCVIDFVRVCLKRVRPGGQGVETPTRGIEQEAAPVQVLCHRLR